MHDLLDSSKSNPNCSKSLEFTTNSRFLEMFGVCLELNVALDRLLIFQSAWISIPQQVLLRQLPLVWPATGEADRAAARGQRQRGRQLQARAQRVGEPRREGVAAAV